jgi:hypothetical protein
MVFGALLLGSSLYAYAGPPTYGDEETKLDALYDPSFDPIGVRVGTFLLNPSFTAGIRQTDNVYAEENTPSSDVVRTMRPELRVRSDFARHKVALYAFGERGSYRDHSAENYEDYGATVDARIDVTGVTKVPIKFGYSRLHEDRETPDTLDSLEPLVYRLTEYSAGIVREGQRIVMKAVGGFKRMVYDEARNISGPLDTSDRDRDILDLYTSIGMSPEAVFSPYVYSHILKLDYHSATVGNSRDSKDLELGVGTIINISDITRVSFNIGHTRRDFESSVFDDVDEFTYGANISWTPIEYLSVLLEADRSVQDAIFSGTASSINMVYRLSANYQFRQNIYIQPSIRYLDRDYQGAGAGQLGTLYAGMNILYKMNPNVWINASYMHTDQEEKQSSAGLESFQRDVYGVSLKLQF